MRAEYRKGCQQRDSVEREEHVASKLGKVEKETVQPI